MSDDRPPSRPTLRLISNADAGEDAPDRGDPTAARDSGARPAGTHVCTWCALRFPSRDALDRHREASPECRANQKVSSPLQTRYGDADMVWTQPGEWTLSKVRAGTCPHTAPRARLVNAAGETIGYQCGWCYSLLRDDLPGG
jgi:hypothetical protein